MTLVPPSKSWHLQSTAIDHNGFGEMRRSAVTAGQGYSRRADGRRLGCKLGEQRQGNQTARHLKAVQQHGCHTRSWLRSPGEVVCAERKPDLNNCFADLTLHDHGQPLRSLWSDRLSSTKIVNLITRGLGTSSACHIAPEGLHTEELCCFFDRFSQGCPEDPLK